MGVRVCVCVVWYTHIHDKARTFDALIEYYMNGCEPEARQRKTTWVVRSACDFENEHEICTGLLSVAANRLLMLPMRISLTNQIGKSAFSERIARRAAHHTLALCFIALFSPQQENIYEIRRLAIRLHYTLVSDTFTAYIRRIWRQRTRKNQQHSGHHLAQFCRGSE